MVDGTKFSTFCENDQISLNFQNTLTDVPKTGVRFENNLLGRQPRIRKCSPCQALKTQNVPGKCAILLYLAHAVVCGKTLKTHIVIQFTGSYNNLNYFDNCLCQANLSVKTDVFAELSHK